MSSEDLKVLKMMCRGAYDLQHLRMQSGLRLCANFRSKLGVDEEAETETEDGELSERAESVLAQLRESYTRLTDGIARNRTLPAAKGFTGDALISTHAELTLVYQYMELEKQELRLFRLLEPNLEAFPIYTKYLRDQRGIGPAMAAVLVTYLDPHKARHPSSFWKYGGLDVGPDGRGRSRREEHLVDRAYTDKNGKEKMRRSVTYNPFLKSKLMGVLAGSFMRSASPWREVYDGYKNRLQTDPKRIKVTVAEWKKRNTAGEDVSPLWTPGRINKAAQRYMVKTFLADFWEQWRRLEGLPTGGTYHSGVLQHEHAA